MGWEQASVEMGAAFSWVSQLQQPTGLFDARLRLTGAQQNCFQRAAPFMLVVFWLFVASEVILVCNSIAAGLLHWRVARRGARQLHEMRPEFCRAEWPTIDLVVCHYGEPAEETTETLKKALAQEYDPAKLHVYICDDGYYKSEHGAPLAKALAPHTGPLPEPGPRLRTPKKNNPNTSNQQ